MEIKYAGSIRTDYLVYFNVCFMTSQAYHLEIQVGFSYMNPWNKISWVFQMHYLIQLFNIRQTL